MRVSFVQSPIVTITLSVAVLLAGAVFVSSYISNVRLPGNDVGYEPAQPVAFSHRLHAGELAIACQFCHTGAARGRTAGIPAASICMDCHRAVTAPVLAVRAEDDAATRDHRAPRLIVSPEIRKVYAALALTDRRTPDATRGPTPIRWVRVHHLPDFVYFNHGAHLAAGVDCQRCHGAVETMERVRQVSELTMGWCVNCHREANAIGINGHAVKAPLDCSACHF